MQDHGTQRALSGTPASPGQAGLARRAVRASAVFVAFLPACLPAFCSSASGTFLLEVPELKIEAAENSTTVIPSSFLNQLDVRVLRSSQEMPPGKIIVRVNGEAANIIMSTTADTSSVLCALYLNYRPGFLLHAGQNVIEASAQSIYGRPYYAVFVLDVRNEPQSLRAIRRETTVSSRDENPPQIHLLDPLGPVENMRELTVKGYIEGGVAPVTVTVAGQSFVLKRTPEVSNTREVHVEGGSNDESVASFSAPVAISLRQSAIEIIAIDAHGNQDKTTIPVVQGARVPAQRWAVVIGVSRYQDSSMNLQYADRDAESMRDFLTDSTGGGVPAANMLFMENEEATTAHIRSALFTFLNKPGPDDLVIFYFAGHGTNDRNSPDNYYLLGYDADKQNLGGTAVRMPELQEAFGNFLRANLIAMVDACHSGGVGKQVPNVTNLRWAHAGFGAHRAVLTASAVGELSEEGGSWGGGHGVFTYFLLQGLKGAAGTKHRGQISVDELFGYVKTHVEQDTHGAQNPQEEAGSEGNLLLTAGRSKVTAFNQEHLTSTRGESQ
jgi:hypothetical protein